MSAFAPVAGRGQASRRSLVGMLLVLLLAVALGLGVVAKGPLALAALLGAFAFVFFLRNPRLGLYTTTLLLLLSGSSATIGSLTASIPVTGAKVCGAATVAAWLLNLSMRKERFYFTREMVVILAFLGWSLIGIAYSQYGRLEWPQWVRVATVAGYFILAVNLLDTPERLHRFAMVVLFCGVVMSAFALLQYVTPSLQLGGEAGLAGVASGVEKAYIDYEGVQTGAAVRVTGLAGHSNWLAMAILLILPFTIYFHATRETSRGKLLAWALAGLQMVALVLTFTRLGLVVVTAVALLMLGKRVVKMNPYRIAALAVALLLVWFALPSAYKERVLALTTYMDSTSSDARMDLQRYAWGYMEDWPLVGTGLGGFGLHFQDENHWVASNLRWLIRYQGWDPVHYGPHSMYLQLGAETGVIGLALMLVLLALLVRRTQKTQRQLRQLGEDRAALLGGAIEIALFAFIVSAFFLHALQQKIWWMMAAMAVAYPIAYSHVLARTPGPPAEESQPS